MPLTGLSKYVKAEKRCLIEAAWEDAWQDLKRGGLMNAAFARRTLASAIVTLASTGESDAVKLKRLARQITRMALRAEEAGKHGRYLPTRRGS